MVNEQDRAKILAFVHGELDQLETQKLATRIEAEAELRKEFEALLATSDGLEDLFLKPATEDLSANQVKELLTAAKTVTPMRRKSTSRQFFIAGGAVFAASVAFVVFMQMHEAKEEPKEFAQMEQIAKSLPDVAAAPPSQPMLDGAGGTPPVDNLAPPPAEKTAEPLTVAALDTQPSREMVPASDPPPPAEPAAPPPPPKMVISAKSKAVKLGKGDTPKPEKIAALVNQQRGKLSKREAVSAQKPPPPESTIEQDEEFAAEASAPLPSALTSSFAGGGGAGGSADTDNVAMEDNFAADAPATAQTPENAAARAAKLMGVYPSKAKFSAGLDKKKALLLLQRQLDGKTSCVPAALGALKSIQAVITVDKNGAVTKVQTTPSSPETAKCLKAKLAGKQPAFKSKAGGKITIQLKNF